MKSVKNYSGRFSSCNFFSDDSSYNSSSGDIIPDDTRSISAVNLSPLINTVVSKVSSVRNEPK
jgi:hypothetical protein